MASLTAESIAQLPWVQAIRPVGEPYRERLSRYSNLLAWHVDVEFGEWTSSPAYTMRWCDAKTRARDTWRKSPLAVGIDSGCEYSCGEVELTARLRNAGYDAFWISEWCGFPHVSSWKPYCVKRSEFKERAPELWAFDQRLRVNAAAMGVALGKRGGHPDVGVRLSLTDEQHVYIEYKGPDDSVKRKQDGWAQAVNRQEEDRLAYLVVRGRFREA